MLDRAVIDQVYRGSGSEPYDPIPLLKMVLFQYLKGIQSPAKWYDEADLNEAMQWLGRGYKPARRTWYDFRDRLSKVIEQVHRQIVTRAIAEKHLDPTTGVQDGTTVAACASRHRTVTQATLDQRSGQLAQIIKGEFEGDLPGWVPPTESGRSELAERMKQASEVLMARIAKNATKPSGKRQKPEKIHVSLTDPMAPIGRDKYKVFRPLYTVQYMVAPGSWLIMAYSCEAAATDAGTLAPMIDKTQEIVAGLLRSVLADSGYCSIVDLQDCRQRNIELLAPVQANSFTESKKKAKPNPQISRDQFEWNEAENCYRCPEGHRLDYQDRMRKKRHSDHQLWESRYRCDPIHCQSCPLAEKCLRPGSASRQIKRLEDQELLDAQRQKMATPEAKERYRLRSQTVELTYADSKGNRDLTRFHGRGPFRALTETGIMVVAQNILRLDRIERSRATAAKIQT
jgi:transposase